MVLDSIVNGRDYEGLEPELVSDWRVHFSHACAQMRDIAVQALRHAGEMPAVPADAAPELAELEHRLAPA
jgi:glycogen synthase